MLTLKLITEDTEGVIKRLARKHFDGRKPIEQVIELNNQRKAAQATLDANLASLNTLSKSIGQFMKEGKKDEAEAAKAKVSGMKESNKKLETQMNEAEEQ